MLVRIMSGRETGSIQDIPFHAAEAGIIMGSFAKVTDDEIAAQGIGPTSQVQYAPPEAFPEGYTATPSQAGAGFDVFDPSGAQISEHPFPNLPAARDAAVVHLQSKQEPSGDASAPEDDLDRKALEKKTRAELEEMAKTKGIDASQAKNKGEIVDMLAPAAGDGAATGDDTGSGAPE